jgi:fermentation-respiration switch protein FrsA (DUF1100 family)
VQPTVASGGVLQAQASRSLDTLLEKTFEALDADGDVRLSALESGLIVAQFSVFDRDRSGFIEHSEWNADVSLEEAREGAKAFRPLIGAAYQQIIRGNNAQEPPRAAEAADRLLGLNSPQDLQRAADNNQDGLVSEAEFEDHYTTLGTAPLLSRGLGTRLGRALLGGYLSVVSRLALKRATQPTRRKVQETPAKFGLAFENVEFKTEDGLVVRGWFIPARIPTEHTVIAYHGISDTRSMLVRHGQVAMLNPYVNQLVMDLRNHGDSEGKLTTFGAHEGLDVTAAVRYLEGRGIRSVMVYGISLGGATAIRGAALNPTLKGLAEDCAYATVQQALSNYISLLFVPSPVLAAAAAIERAKREWGLDMRPTEPLRQIGQVAPRPMLIIHGERDLNISPENSLMVYTAAGNGFDKTLWIAPEAGHADSAVVQKEAYERHLTRFVQRVFGLDTPARPALPQVGIFSSIRR